MTFKLPPTIILGTHSVGDSIVDPETSHFDAEQDVQSLLDDFYGRGYNQLDTARDYSPNVPGASESRLGKAKGASRFTIHTKVHSADPGDHLPTKLGLSIDQSLEDLQTPTVETMFLHFPDRHTPFEDTIKAMDTALKQGKFNRYGLSNYSATEVQRILDICERHGYRKPSVYEGHYNAIVRGAEKELFPLLRKHSMAFYAYSPAAGGLFSGHTASSGRWKRDNFLGNVYTYLYRKPPVRIAAATILELVENYGINGHAAALRWTAFHSNLDGKHGDAVIFGVSKTEQLHETLDALEAGPLPEDLAVAINSIYSTVEGAEPPYHL
ncbi:aflatoxin B1 aldehyde reductase member 2 [Colletotrichum abscissum]|uniref:Aflatoxin B1 aldehyde reductase member 2 n=1 Tax=Colletotrichum abscissum TaxID=1671311 RepID=A0A9P9X954_9PEZI|nr:aflatoxin B1 aldehyde reductase member 2 [Colletotrichum abscissum]KAI3542385.1 aflatoxin B1 aldehyde reductase member 2 [Colletotrichum abscissum]KAK1476933.1 aflatoxin B1 aldehyde reductase member 2 [Colletotrichum abscissum]